LAELKEIDRHKVKSSDDQACGFNRLSVGQFHLPLIAGVTLEAPGISGFHFANRVALQRLYLDGDGPALVRQAEISWSCSIVVIVPSHIVDAGI
jgi:hypothetical protein